jgi:predicted deacylase
MNIECISIGIGLSGKEGIALAGKRYRFTGKGPRVLITGALHGDESTSIGAFWYLADRLTDALLAGIVTVIPGVNVLGIEASSRLIPLEDTDLNRVFPGRNDGSLAERLAAALVDLLNEYDLLIDVHTAGWCIPFVLLDPIADQTLGARIARWAAASGLPVIGEMANDLAALQGLDRSWSAYALSQGKPALTLELTGLHTLDSACARLGGNVLIKLVQAAAGFSEPVSEAPPLPRRLEIYANSSGLFEAFQQPGEQVAASQTIGVIRTTDGTVQETVRTSQGGLLLALQPISAVHVGSFLATLAVGA